MTSPMVRPGATGKSHKAKGIKALAWISYGLSVVAGAALASTFVGDMIAGAIGFFPPWLGSVLLAGGTVAMAIDLFVDGVPNLVALYTAMTLPSVARSVPGRLGDEVTRLTDNLRDQVNMGLSTWLGVSSAVGVALGCTVVALLIARRVIAKGGR